MSSVQLFLPVDLIKSHTVSFVEYVSKFILMRKARLYTVIVLYWVISMLIISLFTLANLKGFLEISQADSFLIENPLVKYWTSPYQILEAIFFGIFFGILFIVIHEISEHINLYKKSFGRVILIKSLMYVAGFAISALLVYNILKNFEVFPDESLDELVHMHTFIRLGITAAWYGKGTCFTELKGHSLHF